MPMTPDGTKELALQMYELYSNAENEILQRMAKRLAAGVDNPDWETRKLAQLKAHTQEMQGVLKQLGVDVGEVTPTIIDEAYNTGRFDVDLDLGDQGERVSNGFERVSGKKVEALSKALTHQLLDIHPQVLRRTNDVYRKTISEVVNQVATGTMTRRQATQAALNRFADQGVGGFVDNRGRQWSMPAYASMATRAGLVQANLAGTIDRMDELGHNLVIVSEHAEECPICRAWEGKVLKLR